MFLCVDERVPEIAHLLNQAGMNLENDVVIKAFDLFTLWHLIFASYGKVLFMYIVRHVKAFYKKLCPKSCEFNPFEFLAGSSD